MQYIPTTLDEIESIPCEILTCEQVSRVLCTKPDSLRRQAQSDKENLGFPVIVVGKRVKIPKTPFLNFMRGIA